MRQTTHVHRLLDAREAQDVAEQLYGDGARDMRFLHVVLAQCGLPYKNPGNVPLFQRTNGNTTLLLTPGALMGPDGKAVLPGLPYGPKPRLLMLHLCTQAVRYQTPTVEIGNSMSGLMADLGLAVTGGVRGSIRSFKEQMNRLASTHVQFGRIADGQASTFNPAPMIERMDVWFPTEAKQRTLWPTVLRLSDSFYESLRENAMPLDLHAVRALQSSAMKLDIYTWLSHRLCRVPANKPSLISWAALKQQFGQDFADTSEGSSSFKQQFRAALTAVKAVYRDANIAETKDGRVELRQSKPPISKVLAGK